MKPHTAPLLPRPPGLDPLLFGTFCCIVSALSYTGVNVCLRALAAGDDQLWVICVKEAVTVAVVGPWLAVALARGRFVLPPCRAIFALAVVGLAVQLAGNVTVLWALDVIGLSVAIPIVSGCNLMFSAVFGWLLIGERVAARSVVAMTLVIGSIALLHAGAGQADASVTAEAWKVGVAVALACLAGMVYALLATTIRKTVTGATPPAAIALIVTGMGVLSLGPLSLWQLGPNRLLTTPSEHFGLMLLSGVLNLVAFLAIIVGLRFTTVVHANLVNASQVAMAALAGLIFFQERPSWELATGILVMIAGMIVHRPPRP